MALTSRTHRQRGFSMLEAIVVLAIIVALLGVVMPILSAEVEDSRLSRALGDASRIATAVDHYVRDLGHDPGAAARPGAPAVLVTSGAHPQGLPAVPRARLSEMLARPAEKEAQASAWKGPYLGEVGADPWGHAYVVILPAAGSADRGWVVSSGRDGVLETTERVSEVKGDDVGIRIR